ncbi:calmodulin-like protein 3 [Selaginella moellendorffii]|nr:calmodulin-like protein 3 [Selaginella moellendorffii]|eukprot:XP_002978778.2 calmodulin-like protein 3 [Selaginella moellendorffii]
MDAPTIPQGIAKKARMRARDSIAPCSLHLPHLMDYGWHCQPLLTPSPSPSCPRALNLRGRKEEERELWNVFQEFDSNRDGLICKGDIAQMMLRLDRSLSDRDVAATLEAIDEDGDGFVDFGEFCSIFHGRRDILDGEEAPDCEGEDQEEEDLMEAFRVFDRDNDGFITVEELHTVLARLGFVEEHGGRPSCSRMIRMVDSNGDGLVDFLEFKRMMSQAGSRGTH